MKKITFTLIVSLFGLAAFSQTDTTTPPKPWQWSGLYSASLSQTSLTNWAAGGNDNVNINALVKQLAVYSKDKWVWNNYLELNYGHNFQSGSDIKTDDKIEFTSRLDRELQNPDWRLSLFANFRTQFTDGFTDADDTARISTFMAPAYLTYGLGLTNTSVEGLSIYLSPATVKQTFVADSILFASSSFFDRDLDNVGELSNGGMRTEVGAYLDIFYKKSLAKNIEMTSKLNLFSNYLDRPQNIDVNFETIFLVKVYSFLSVSLQLNAIYDHDVHVRDSNGDGTLNAPGTQFKQILGVGLAYSFGEFKK